MDFFGKSKLDLVCPSCGSPVRNVSMKDIRLERAVRCIRGHVGLQDENRGVSKANKEFQKFEKEMKKLGFNIKYK